MNNLIKTEPLTKKVILEELWKMKVDHSIQISEKELDMKINLLFEDCKYMTVDAFKINAKKLRHKEMYGKLPANHFFINESGKGELLADFINNLMGDTLITKIIVSDSNKAQIWFNDSGAFDKYQKLSNETKNKIKDKITTELGTTGFEPKF